MVLKNPKNQTPKELVCVYLKECQTLENALIENEHNHAISNQEYLKMYKAYERTALLAYLFKDICDKRGIK